MNRYGSHNIIHYLIISANPLILSDYEYGASLRTRCHNISWSHRSSRDKRRTLQGALNVPQCTEIVLHRESSCNIILSICKLDINGRKDYCPLRGQRENCWSLVSVDRGWWHMILEKGIDSVRSASYRFSSSKSGSVWFKSDWIMSGLHATLRVDDAKIWSGMNTASVEEGCCLRALTCTGHHFQTSCIVE